MGFDARAHLERMIREAETPGLKEFWSDWLEALETGQARGRRLECYTITISRRSVGEALPAGAQGGGK